MTLIFWSIQPGIVRITMLFYLVTCFGLTNAQISINANDFPGKGDTVRYSNTNGFLADFTSTGPNYTWNFNSLTAQSQTLIEHSDPDLADAFTQSLFGSTVLPTYRATFYLPAKELPVATLSNFVDVPIDDIYRFYRKTNQQVNVIGLSIAAMGFAIGKRADTIEVAYKFPMEYGQTYESNGFVNLDLSAIAPFSLKQYRERISEVDGWGTISTSYGTFECLRIHHIIKELDSVLIDLGEGPAWYPIDIPTIHEFEWWTNDQKGPILKAKANEIFGFPIVNEIQFRDIFRPELNVGVDEILQNDVQVYPNPVEDILTILNANPKTEFKIINASGQFMMSISSDASILVENLQAGLYFLVAENEGAISMPIRFIKK